MMITKCNYAKKKNTYKNDILLQKNILEW